MSTAEAQQLQEIIGELDTVRLSDGPVMTRLAGPCHELLGGELLWTYRPVRGLGGWHIDDVFGSGITRKYVEGFRRAVAHELDEFAWFKPTRPEPSQRNRVIEALSAVRKQRPGYFESTPLYRDFFVPMGLHEHHQLRVLLCDGPSLLAWFGVYQRERPTARQVRLMRALVPSLRRRFAHDRRMADGLRIASALEHVIEHIGVAAFVLGPSGRIELANAIGRKRLGRALTTAMEDAIAGRAATPRVELFRLQPRGYLALLPEETDANRIAQHAGVQWRLTRRQTEVLALLVRGQTNHAIAEAMSITERAVELHVSALFDKAGVHSRAGLVAAAFTR